MDEKCDWQTVSRNDLVFLKGKKVNFENRILQNLMKGFFFWQNVKRYCIVLGFVCF